MSSASIRFSQHHELLCPAGEESIPVTVSQWARFMKRISDSGDHSNFYQSAGWASLGFAGSMAVSAVTFPFSVVFFPANSANMAAIVTEVAFVALTMTCAAIGVITLIYSKQHSQDRADLRRVIVDDMQDHALRCQKIPAAAP